MVQTPYGWTQGWHPISFDSVPRDFLPLEDTNHFPNNGIRNDPEEAFSPEDGSRRAYQSSTIYLLSWPESIPTHTSEEEGGSFSWESFSLT